MEAEEIKTRIHDVTKNLVDILIDYPDDLRIEVTVTGQVMVINMVPIKSDVGKIIGKHGKNISAIRTLLSAYANRFRYRCHVEVVE